MLQDVISNISKRAEARDNIKNVLKVAQNDLKEVVGTVPDLGIAMKPISKHCPFAYPGIRECCDTHRIMDLETEAESFGSTVFAFRSQSYGVCMVERCKFCSSELTPNIVSEMFSTAAGVCRGSIPIFDAMTGQIGVSEKLADVVNLAHANRHVLDEVSSAAGSINSAAGSATSIVSFLIRALETVREGFKNGLDMAKSKPMLTIGILFCAFVLAVIGYSHFKLWVRSIYNGLKTIVSMGVHSVFSTIFCLWETIVSHVPGMTMKEQNPGEHEIDRVNIVAQSDDTSATSFVATMLLMALPASRHSARNMMLAFSKASSLSKGLETAKDGLSWLANMLPTYIQEFLTEVFGINFDVRVDETFRDDLVRANELNMRYKKEGNETFKDIDFCTQCVGLYSAIKTQAPKELAHLANSSATRHLVNMVIKDLETYVAGASEACMSESTRTVPFGLYMWGAPGIGKSTVISNLARATFPDIPVSALAYGRNFSDPFWSRYLGQPFVFVDDYGTSTTSTGQEFTSEIMQLISSTPYGLKMAGVTEKGMQFKSKVVMLTSNKALDQTHIGISCQGAFIRRFVGVHAKLRPEFCNSSGGLDEDKLAALSDNDKALCVHLAFDKYDQIVDRKSGRRTIALSKDKNLSLVDIAVLLRAGVITRELERRRVGKGTQKFVDAVERVIESQMFTPDSSSESDIKTPLPSDVETTSPSPHARRNTKSARRKAKRNKKVYVADGDGAVSEIVSERSDDKTYVRDGDLVVSEVASERSDEVDDFKHGPADCRLTMERARNVCMENPPPESLIGLDSNCTKVMAFKNMCSKVYEDMHNRFQNRLAIDMTVLAKGLGFFAAAASMFGAFKLARNLFSSDPDNMEGFIDAESRKNVVRNHRKRGSNVRNEPDLYRRAVIDSQISCALDDFKHEEQKKQTGMFRKIYDAGVLVASGGGSMYATMVKSNLMLVNRHFFLRPNPDKSRAIWLATGTKFSIGTKNGASYIEEFDPQKLHAFGVVKHTAGDAALDLCLYETSKSMPMFSDITKYFVTQSDVNRISSLDQAYLLRPCVEEGSERWSVMDNVELCHERNVWSAAGCKTIDTYAVDWVSYSAQRKGDCGSLLLIPTAGHRKILSLHMAGRTVRGETVGMGCIVTQELLLKLIASVDSREFGSIPQSHMDVKAIDIGCASIDETCYRPELLKGSFDYLGKFGGPVGGLASTTKLVPSKIAHATELTDVFSGPDRFEPAILGNDPRFPGHSAVDIALRMVSNGGTTATYMPEQHVEMAKQDLVEHFTRRKSNVNDEILSLHEAINGSDRYPGLGPIPMNTSEGFPYTMRRPVGESSKRWMFSDDDTGNRDIVDEQLKDDITRFDQQIRKGVRPNFVFTYCLKDELRTMAKIKTASTRVICAAPVCNTILMRKYFGAFVSFFHGVNVQSMSAIGMNVYSTDWDSLMKKLYRVSDVGFDGDYKKFEKYLNSQNVQVIFSVIDAWYGPEAPMEDRIARYTLLMGLLYTICRVGPHVFRKTFGNPSGNVLTGIINTILNALFMRVAWIQLARSSDNYELSYMHVYNKLVAEIYWGDDHMHAVHPKASFFNCAAVSEVLEKYLITYTSADKVSETSAKLRPLCDCEFVKCKDVRHRETIIPGMIHYPRALPSSLLKSLCYVSGKLDVWEATETNIDDCLRRAVCGGPEIFAFIRKFCMRELSNGGSLFVPITYSAAVDMLKRGQVEFNVKNGEPSFLDTFVHVGPRARVDKDVVLSPFCPPDLRPFIVAQMDDGSSGIVDDTSPADIQAPVASSEVAPPSGELAPVPKQMRYTSCKDIIKRYGAVFNNGGANIQNLNTLYPARLLSPVETAAVNGELKVRHITWWSALFRFWKGSIRYKLFASIDSNFSYTEVNSPVNTTAAAGLGDSSVGTVDNHSGGWLPYAVTRRDIGLVEVQIPFITPYKMLRIPKTAADVSGTNLNIHQAGAVSVFSDTAGDDDSRIWAACGDDMRFSYIMGIPRLMVVNSLGASHTGSGVVEVAEFYNVLAQPGVFGTVSQDMLNRWVMTSTTTTRLQQPNQITIATSSMTNADLIKLGINIPPHATLRIQPGVTTTVLGVYLGRIYVVESVNILDTPVAGAGATFKDGIVQAHMVPGGNVQEYFDESGKGLDTVCDEIVFSKGAYLSPEFRTYVGIPTVTDIIGLACPVLPGTFELVGKTGPLINFYSGDAGFQVINGTKVYVRAEMNSVTDAATGVSFSDTTAAPPTVGGRGVNLVVDETKNDMSEQQIDYVSLAERFQWTETILWNTNQGLSTVLGSYNVPWDLLSSTANRNPFQQFVYWRGTVKLKFQLQSNMFQQGSLIAWFVPVTSFDELAANGSLDNRTSQTVVPHVIMQAGASRNATLEIPFVHYLERLDPGDASTTSLGTLVISVFNRLKTGDLASGDMLNCKLSVFASFPNSQFQVIAPTTVEIIPQGAVASTMKDVGDNITGVIGKTIDFADKNADKIAAVGALGGLDRPNCGINTSQFVAKKYPELANACNVDQNQVLALYPNRTCEMAPIDVGCNEDEMSFAHLRSLRSLLGTYEWEAKQQAGDTILTGLLVPTPGAISTILSGIFTPTMLEYTTLPFALWRGGLRYRIQIIGSKVHTGRLVFCTHYGRVAEAIPFEEAMSQYAHVFDFSADQNVFEVTVPWRSNREMLRVPTGSATNISDYSMGEYSIRIVTPLQYMESVANNVEVNVYLSAADDFETDYVGVSALDFKVV